MEFPSRVFWVHRAILCPSTDSAVVESGMQICETPESAESLWVMALLSTKWLEYVRLVLSSGRPR